MSKPDSTVTSGKMDIDAGAPLLRGTITLIYGCMFSGKTTLLLEQISAIPASSALVIKHALDHRYANASIVTHSGLSRSATPVNCAADILRCVQSTTTAVAIDEAHFFDDGLAGVVRDLSNRGLGVLLTSLEPDSWGVSFPFVTSMKGLADKAILRKATCARCGAEAERTQRLTPIIDGNMLVGPECYEPRCRSCWSPPPEPRPQM